jgi:small-conductance mechanosensitive channel
MRSRRPGDPSAPRRIWRGRRPLDAVDVPTLQHAVANAVTPDFRVALGAVLLAIVALAVPPPLDGDIHGPALHQKLIAAGGAAGFVVFAGLATRSLGNELIRVLSPRTGPTHASVVRWVVVVAGFAIIVLTALGLLDVPVQHLLLGGALTGVIVGIAAQQALGNVFAGVVLLIARPFSVGDDIRLRAGALGGELSGRVLGMGLAYVSLELVDGPMSVPNSLVLAAGAGPAPLPPPGESTAP